MTAPRTPVVTGAGIICSAGCGRSEVWSNLTSGKTFLGPLTLFNSVRYGSHLVGEVRADVDRLSGKVRGSRTDRLAWFASAQALREAQLEPGAPELKAAGVFVGTTVGGMLGTERVVQALLQRKTTRLTPLRFHDCYSVADVCAKLLRAGGPAAAISTACSGGAMAIAAAGEAIASGEADLVLAGGADTLCRLTLNGFGSLLLLDPKGCRPFDANRAGISLGEGAAMLVIEAEDTARRRGVPILARLKGWGASCDAWHATAPHPDGEGALRAMQAAMEKSGLRPEEIDCVIAHGTGTRDNDAMEAKALRSLFGENVPSFSSLKGSIGHTLGASGAVNAVMAVEALRNQKLLPCPGFRIPDSTLGLEPVVSTRDRKVGNVLINAFGFGGNNVSLVLSRPALETAKALPAPRVINSRNQPQHPPLAVHGIGVISPAGNSLEEVARTFANGGATPSLIDVPLCTPPSKVAAFACPEFNNEVIEPARRRRLSRIQQMAIVAAKQALQWLNHASLSKSRASVVMGTGLGSMADTASFVENMFQNEERAPRPAAFAGSVHNALASQVALELGFKGLNSTMVARETSFESALWQSVSCLTDGKMDLALAGAADELNQYMLLAGKRWKWWSEHSSGIRPFSALPGKHELPPPGEGCVMFALAPAGVHPSELARIRFVRIGRTTIARVQDIDAAAEAEWIRQATEENGVQLGEVDAFLTGANGFEPLDKALAGISRILSGQAGRPIPHAAYKQCCGEWHSASAFGLLTAICLVRGLIPLKACVPTASDTEPRCACRQVLLYTISPSGTKSLCCVDGVGY